MRKRLPTGRDDRSPASRCAKCGACTAVCPVFRVTGREALAPRGKVHLLGQAAGRPVSGALAGIVARCLLCGACAATCPRQVDTPRLIVEARGRLGGPAGDGAAAGRLLKAALARPAVWEKCLQIPGRLGRALAGALPPESGLRLRLSPLESPEWLEPAPQPAASARSRTDSPALPARYSYFGGCLARHLYPEIGAAMAAISRHGLASALEIPELQTCCGLALAAAGDPEQARRLARRNLEAFGDSSLPILTSCSSCYAHLRAYPDLFAEDPVWHGKAVRFAARLLEMTSSLAAAPGFLALLPGPASGAAPVRVLYHDPCHLRFGLGITAPPRTLLRALPGVELLDPGRGPWCCGSGGLFGLSFPELASRILARPLQDAAALGVQEVVTTCSGCLLQWRKGLFEQRLPARATHLALLLARRLA